ncbi:cytotoxic and regulatory T-cell molecule [Nelusetta ayraudi]|uniref:cytotoxic and regulatory T-cell molecule n=1 Tax=Nelusetta ayraudi TaxID=303726 RepID=UPI003F6F7E98
MEQKLLFCVFMLLVQVSLAKWQHMTAVKGETVHLRCPTPGANETSMDWKNQQGHILFFKLNSSKVFKGLRSQRFQIVELSASEFTVRISPVMLKDGGNYTCTQYGDQPTQNIVQLTVLGPPKMKTAKKRGTLFVKCTAEASHYHPQISWNFGRDSEIPAEAHFIQRNKKYVSRATLILPSSNKSLTVICLVRPPDLKGYLLMDIVKFGQNSEKGPDRSTAATTRFSTDELHTATTSWLEHGETTGGVDELLTGSTLDSSTASPGEQGTEYNSRNKEKNTVPDGSTYHTDTTGGTSFNETTEEPMPYNNTGPPNDLNRREGGPRGSGMLIFMVTCLILCLMVVVIFIAIKLRKAHIAWKKENEDSIPSVESSKSKSSQDESASQGQRRRGILNTAFAHYAVEQQMATSVINTAAMAAPSSPIKEPTSSPQTTQHIASICYPKETEL